MYLSLPEPVYIVLHVYFAAGSLLMKYNTTRRGAVYLGTHCNIGSKRCADFPTGVLGR